MKNLVDLKNLFNPKTVAVIGASRNPEKVGHVLFRNLLESNQDRIIFPINLNAKEVLGKKSYKNVKEIKEKIDLAIIAIPAKFVFDSVKECKDKGIKDLIIVSSGFSEMGDKTLEEKIKNFLNKYKMRAVGVNCLGIYDAQSSMNALFIPRERMEFPKPGGISFVCQSGAIGLAIIDLAAARGYKFSKFVSYGNATQLDESDYLDYLANDKNTKVICMYIEGVKDGKKFYDTAKRVAKKKPIVVVKGGLSPEGKKATLSHTGSLAGAKETYFGVFEQVNIIKTDNLEGMFHVASLLENGIIVKGNRVQVITNGGGYGIVSTDEISASKNLKFSKLSPETEKKLRRVMPDYVHIRNPLDISGDATTQRYNDALRYILPDKNVDIIIVVALYQTPLITEDITNIISQARSSTKKSIIVISTGSDFTEKLSDKLEKNGVPVFLFPHSAITALDKVVGYIKKL